MRKTRSELWMPNASSFYARRGRYGKEDFDSILSILSASYYNCVPQVPNALHAPVLRALGVYRVNPANTIMSFDNSSADICTGVLLHSEASRVCHIDYVAILPSAQRNGWGTFLLAKSLINLYSRSVSEIHVFAPKELVSWFRRASFAPTGKPAPEGCVHMFTRVSKAIANLLGVPRELLAGT